MWAQAAILLCSSFHLGYAVTGFVTINDEQVPTDSATATARDYNAVGYYHYYAGERVRISCSQDSTASAAPELLYGKGHERHECKKPDNEGNDVTPSLSVTLTEASDRAYAQCAAPAAAAGGAAEHSLRSRVYFVLRQLPRAGALYFLVNGVPLVPAPARDGAAPRTHRALQYGYYTGEQLEVASAKDADTYGAMECVLTGEDIPSELDDLKSPRVLDSLNFVARLQKQRVSLDCRVQIKTTDAQPRRNIHISLYLKPLGDSLKVKEFPYSCRIPTFFLQNTDTVTITVTSTNSNPASAIARANAIHTATATSTATAPNAAIATSTATAANTATAQATGTGAVSATVRSESTATNTASATVTATSANTATATSVASATDTATTRATGTGALRAIIRCESTARNTATATVTATSANSATGTSISSATNTATATSTVTGKTSSIAISIATATSTASATATASA